MNFEIWTNTFVLLGHAGFGVVILENKDLHQKDSAQVRRVTFKVK